MGYSLELGYWEVSPLSPGQPPEYSFRVAKVKPFNGGHNLPADRLVYEMTGEAVREIDEDKLVEASMDVTSNYSRRILEVTGVYVSYIHGAKASDVAPVLMHLISGLSEEGPSDDYWKATDGNIKNVANAVLGWTLQHPDAEFVWLP